VYVYNGIFIIFNVCYIRQLNSPYFWTGFCNLMLLILRSWIWIYYIWGHCFTV